jgi:ribosomal protein S18 acetylase RimI-like enzyme
MLYRKDRVWIPPLRNEIRKEFDPKKNPFLQHCEWQLFLLKEKGNVIGRIVAFIDTLAMDFWKERIGFFGYFDCIQDEAASRILLDAAKKWLLERQCITMRGPWTFFSQEWGMVLEGFEPSPVIMAPYNPPWYNDIMTGYGLEKAKDLLCWEISFDDGYRFPERINRLTDAVAKRYGISVRHLNMKEYDKELDILIELSNNSIIENWGYSPVTEDEVTAIANDMKQIIQPKGVLFAEDSSGRPVGFAIVIPDINSLLKGLNGRMFPFGFIKLLWGIPRLHRYRMFALGVLPEYQGKAIDSLLYRELNRSLSHKNLWMEINYVLEDNWIMINAIKKLNAKPSRRYRVYEMGIARD